MYLVEIFQHHLEAEVESGQTIFTAHARYTDDLAREEAEHQKIAEELASDPKNKMFSFKVRVYQLIHSYPSVFPKDR